MFGLTRSAMDAGGRRSDVRWKASCMSRTPLEDGGESGRGGENDGKSGCSRQLGGHKGHTEAQRRAGEGEMHRNGGKNLRVTRAFKVVSEIPIKISARVSTSSHWTLDGRAFLSSDTVVKTCGAPEAILDPERAICADYRQFDRIRRPQNQLAGSPSVHSTRDG